MPDTRIDKERLFLVALRLKHSNQLLDKFKQRI